MLPIAAKLQTLAKELDSAIAICNEIIPVLAAYPSSAELPDKIGVFAKKMPDYKILTDEKQYALNLIRKTCTLELPVPKALEEFKEGLHHLMATRKLIDIK